MNLADRTTARIPLEQQVRHLWDIADDHSRRLEGVEAAQRETTPLPQSATQRPRPSVWRSLPPLVRRHRGGLLGSGFGAILVLALQELARYLAAHPW